MREAARVAELARALLERVAGARAAGRGLAGLVALAGHVAFRAAVEAATASTLLVACNVERERQNVRRMPLPLKR